MTFDGLVTFWALIIAGYSVLPEYWKFKVKAFVGLPPALLVFVVTSTLVFISVVLEDRESATTVGRLGQTSSLLQFACYAVLSLFVLWIVWRLWRSRVTAQNLSRFGLLLASLALGKRYDLIGSVLKDNAKKLAEVYNYTPLWRRLLNKWRQRKRQHATEVAALPFLVKPTVWQEGVLSVFNQVMSNQELTQYLVGYDTDIPLLVIEAAEGKTYRTSDYLHSVLSILISRTDSELYREIGRHQNVGSGIERVFEDSRLLRFLFGNAEQASKWSVWTPVGEYVLHYLSERPGGVDDEYNRADNYYTDLHGTERFSDPAFIGLEYFDFMIRGALAQGTRWHMWLYYLRHWTKEIVGKVTFDPVEWKKGNWEYPTRYAFLLYKIVQYQLEWCNDAVRSGLDIAIENMHPNDNGNILKCGAECMADCLNLIAPCGVGEDFKRSLLTSWWNTYFVLKGSSNAKHGKLADFLLKTMVDEIHRVGLQQAIGEAPLPLPLLGKVVSGLCQVDDVVVDHTTYADRMGDMKQLLREIVLPQLIRTYRREYSRSEVLETTLGSEFRLQNNTICVPNILGSVTLLVRLE